MAKNQSNSNKSLIEINSLLAREELVVYFDLTSVKNSRDLIEYFHLKVEKLKSQGFSDIQILKILLICENLKENLLNKDHYIIFKQYLESYIGYAISVDPEMINS